MRLRWTPAAAADLSQISEYLKNRHPRYRQPTIRKLYEAISSLTDSPSRGRPGRESATRELLIPPLPYIVVYRIHHVGAGPTLILRAGRCSILCLEGSLPSRAGCDVHASQR